jgi:hypothetical protein
MALAVKQGFVLVVAAAAALGAACGGSGGGAEGVRDGGPTSPAAGSCTGAVPPHSTMCPGTDAGLTSDAPRVVAGASCAAAPPCSYVCNAGFVVSGGACVTAPSAPPAAVFTDNGDGTVTDAGGLTWLKEANCTDEVVVDARTVAGGTASWEDAVAWSGGLADGACGLRDGSVRGDWRLPTHVELAHLAVALASGSPFPVQSGTYWSSWTYWPDKAGAVDLPSGGVLRLPEDVAVPRLAGPVESPECSDLALHLPTRRVRHSSSGAPFMETTHTDPENATHGERATESSTAGSVASDTEFPLEPRATTLAALCGPAVADVAARFPDRVIVYAPDPDPGRAGAGEWDPGRIVYAVTILIEDALKRSRAGDRVSVRWREHADVVVLRVEYPRPLEQGDRFVTYFEHGVPPDGANDSVGSLRLLAARRIARQHRGDLARIRTWSGTAYVLDLPRSATAREREEW